MSRTGMFGALRRLMAASTVAARTGRRSSEVLADWSARRAAAPRGPSRRDVLRQSLGAAVVLPLAAACGDDSDDGVLEVAVVGGGIAGLHCAFRLAEQGVGVRVFESSDRTGGRMWTGRGLYPDGMVFELGGELVDTGHATIRGLAEDLGLTLDDLPALTTGLRADTFFFDGGVLAEATLVDEFTPVAAAMSAAVTAAEADDTEFARVDGMSIPEWLEGEAGLASTSLIRRVLELAYTGEYGLEPDEQSILNVLYLIDAEQPDPFRIFGDSDERFHVHEGSDAIPAGLAEALGADRIATGHSLARVVTRDDGAYDLTFSAGGGETTVVARHVVFALPFTRLRQVDLSAAGLSADKQGAIDELGYGTNAKLMLGFASRPWVDAGASGSSFCDVGSLQTTWDTSRGQDSATGILTNFVGGQAGVAMGDGTPEERAAQAVPWIDALFAGSEAAYTAGSAQRMHWPTYPHALGSYACYRPGQWAFYGTEGTREGNLHFCGEHTSLDFQGYMEGGAETGALVAAEILDDLGLGPSARLRELLVPKLALPQATYHAHRFGGTQRRLRRNQRRRLRR